MGRWGKNSPHHQEEMDINWGLNKQVSSILWPLILHQCLPSAACLSRPDSKSGLPGKVRTTLGHGCWSVGGGEKQRKTAQDITYMRNLEQGYKWTHLPNRNRLRFWKQICGYQREKVGGGIDQESEINIYMLLYRKQITSKDLLYSTGNYTQYFVKIYKGKDPKKNICV